MAQHDPGRLIEEPDEYPADDRPTAARISAHARGTVTRPDGSVRETSSTEAREESDSG